MNRRKFLLSSSMALLAASRPGQARTRPAIGRLGAQLFSIPKLLEADFGQAIGSLAALGYREVELYGPYPFSAPEVQAQWLALKPQLGFSGSGFFGLTVAQVHAVLRKHGMTAPSMHTDLSTLQTRMGELAAAAHAVGARYVVLPAIPEAKRRTLDDYKAMADAFNAIGEQARREGVRFGYHNHGYGLQDMQGTVPLRMLLERTDPDRVFFEMDIYWTTAGGADPVELLASHPHRYRMLHLKDMKQRVRFKGDGGDSSQWVELFPYMCPVGDGVLDIRAIVAQAKASGVELFFVEQDMASDGLASMKRSADFLTAI